jgi:hypothetical protein
LGANARSRGRPVRHDRPARGMKLSRFERTLFATTGAILAALRLIALVHYRVNSDEPQHLHVAWGWSQGLLSYRDVFDNHMPLFHILSAPLIVLLGERPDVVLWMRAPMLLLLAATLIAAFSIARRVYSLRVACWTVLIVAAYPPFFLKTLEYRADNLWTALSMLSLALLITGTSPALRVLAGFVLGCAMCTSLRTAVLVLALSTATLVVHVFYDRDGSESLWRRAAAPAAAFLVPPLLLVAFFYFRGAWKAMVYCLFTFNLMAANARVGQLLYPICMLLIILLAARLARRNAVDRDRAWLALLLATFCVTTQAFWPMLSPRDYLAVMPLMAMFLAAAVPRHALTALTVVFVLSLFHYADMFRDRAREHVAMMRQVLDLTRPGDCVMDLKGETIYRRRPFYYALETIARTAISRRLMTDRIPEAMIAKRCHVAAADVFDVSPRSRAFLTANFLDLGAIRAAGQWIGSDGSFSVAIPGLYVIASRQGLARGLIDGVQQTGPVLLDAGTHHFARAAAAEPVACLWASAFERGYSPFAQRRQ